MSMLHAVLNSYRSIGALSRVEHLGGAGGLSGAEFWRIETARGQFVLRRWPKEHPSAERLQFIHAVLEHAKSRGITVLPVPLRTDDGRSFETHVGHLWELSPWLPGATDFAESRSPERLRAAMECLAGFHRAAADFPSSAPTNAPSPGVHKRIAQIEQDLPKVSDADELASEMRSAAAACAPAAIQVLKPLAGVSVQLQPCLRDVWHENVLFEGNVVTGLMDFGAMDWETPAIDVARLLGSMAGNGAAFWQLGLAAYAAVRPLSPLERQFVVAFDASGILVGAANWLRWLYVENRQFDDNAKVIGRMRELLARLKYFRERGSPAAIIQAGNTTGPSSNSR